jgi:hypothetical protein
MWHSYRSHFGARVVRLHMLTCKNAYEKSTAGEPR